MGDNAARRCLSGGRKSLQPRPRHAIVLRGSCAHAAARGRALVGSGEHAHRRRSASGEGRGLCRGGMMLPPYDTRDTLSGSPRCIEHLRARAASWRSATASTEPNSPRRLDGADRAALAALQRGREWYWVLGQSRPELPECVGGVVCTALTIGGITLRHEPSDGDRPRARSRAICIPVARIARRGEGDQAQMLRHRRPAPGDAGLRRLYRRAQRARRCLRRAVPAAARSRPGCSGSSEVYPIGARVLLPD